MKHYDMYSVQVQRTFDNFGSMLTKAVRWYEETVYIQLDVSILQGGQNFFKKVRTKIRTFSEQIRTIRTFFGKNPYIKKNPYKKQVNYDENERRNK